MEGVPGRQVQIAISLAGSGKAKAKKHSGPQEPLMWKRVQVIGGEVFTIKSLPLHASLRVVRNMIVCSNPRGLHAHSVIPSVTHEACGESSLAEERCAKFGGSCLVGAPLYPVGA